MLSNMKAVELVRARITYSASAVAELALWQVPKPLAGSRRGFKYRLVYVVGGGCVVRYDNEGGIVFPYEAVKVEFLLQAA